MLTDLAVMQGNPECETVPNIPSIGGQEVILIDEAQVPAVTAHPTESSFIKVEGLPETKYFEVCISVNTH